MLYEVNVKIYLQWISKYYQIKSLISFSSGCGRTGTFIAMDAMIKEFEKTGKIDIFAFVDQMRKQRTSMVQEQVRRGNIMHCTLMYLKWPHDSSCYLSVTSDLPKLYISITQVYSLLNCRFGNEANGDLRDSYSGALQKCYQFLG